jgi:hypothetical protein
LPDDTKVNLGPPSGRAEGVKLAHAWPLPFGLKLWACFPPCRPPVAFISSAICRLGTSAARCRRFRPGPLANELA